MSDPLVPGHRYASGAEELPPVERFPLCEDGARCRWCQFRGPCEGSRRGTAKERLLTVLND